MHSKKFETIINLMEELKEEMQYSPDDLSERLGRKKPDLEVVKIEGEMPSIETQEEEIGADLDGDMEMGEDPEHQEMVVDESPDDNLKKRLMALRG